jgi:uncharacterized protein (DUF427 family)
MTQILPEWIRLARSKWRHRGQEKPAFAQKPNPGQESVWDYPRPPCLVPDHRRVVVRARRKVLADSSSTFRILETAGPPTFYLPPGDVNISSLIFTGTYSTCEWKGTARYCALAESEDKGGEPVAWVYLHPYPGFESIAGFLSFYPGRIACYVNDERVLAQPGGLYGGWVTSEIVGPYKGLPGTEWW